MNLLMIVLMCFFGVVMLWAGCCLRRVLRARLQTGRLPRLRSRRVRAWPGARNPWGAGMI